MGNPGLAAVALVHELHETRGEKRLLRLKRTARQGTSEGGQTASSEPAHPEFSLSGNADAPSASNRLLI